MIFESIEGLLCDLDGVIYRGDSAILGAAEVVKTLRQRGAKVVFCTNNSRWTVGQYVDKLASFGLDARPHDILTSATVVGEALRQRGLGGARALVVGGEGILEAMEGAGIEVVDDVPAELVVVGLDPAFDYEKMKRAALAVRDGATFVATNDDAALPVEGSLWPGAGAILASIEVASGGSAEIMGKPYAPMMQAAARRLRGAERIAVVGDRPETDLKGGASMKWTTVLVLSGVTSREEAKRLDSQPDFVIDGLADLPSI